MKKILEGYFKYIILGIILIISIISIFLMLRVEINYDLSKYLPSDSTTQKGLDILDDEFGVTSSIQVMADDVNIPEALSLKSKIIAIDEVSHVIWLDDLEDINQPVNSMDQGNLDSYYKESKALFTVVFKSGDYDLETEDGINKIRSLSTNNDILIRGEAISNIETRNLTNDEISKIIFIVLPFALIILLLASNSWFEPVPILITIGIAILINMGTNVIFSSVSFITFSMAAVLQLAISLDYSLFLINRFYEESDNGNGVVDSVVKATKKSVSSITASSLTTIAGFIALLAMRYEIGRDIGFVMAKGVLFSYLATIIILPILLVIFAPILKKGRHKNFLPKFKNASKVLKPLRFVILGVVTILAVGGLILSNKTNYYYGMDLETDAEKEIITETFNHFEPVVVLVPKGNATYEYDLIADLKEHPNIISVQGLYSFVDPEIPKQMIPSEQLGQFEGENYAQIVANTNLNIENKTMYEFNDDLENMVRKYYEEFYFAGEATSITDIKNTATADSTWVMIFSIAAVLLILMIVFKFNFAPVLLFLLIQTAIWVNFSIPYLEGTSLTFIGYLVVSSLQLGATIDYAVLLFSRYQEERKIRSSFDAMDKAIIKTSPAILTSALILTVAGFLLGIVSSVSAVKEMGILIGRGALLSGVLVLFALGPILVIFDKLIHRKKKEEITK